MWMYRCKTKRKIVYRAYLMYTSRAQEVPPNCSIFLLSVTVAYSSKPGSQIYVIGNCWPLIVHYITSNSLKKVQYVLEVEDGGYANLMDYAKTPEMFRLLILFSQPVSLIGLLYAIIRLECFPTFVYILEYLKGNAEYAKALIHATIESLPLNSGKKTPNRRKCTRYLQEYKNKNKKLWDTLELRLQVLQ